MNKRVLLSVASLAAGLAVARADERFFTYVYDAEVEPKGEWEFEQWLTYRKGYPEGDRQFSQHLWDFREEIEYGLTERLTTSFYLNFQGEQVVAREAGLEDSSDFSFKGVSAEFKYQLLNPNKKPLGLALYLEPTYNGNEYELEEKLILSRNWGDNWVTAFNATVEQEWEKEGGETEKEAVFELSAGVAYRLTPNWAVGVEGRFHTVYEGLGFDEHLGTAWFIGPNIHYGTSKWWATLTILPQVAGHPEDGGINLNEHQIFETRLVFGIDL